MVAIISIIIIIILHTSCLASMPNVHATASMDIYCSLVEIFSYWVTITTLTPKNYSPTLLQTTKHDSVTRSLFTCILNKIYVKMTAVGSSRELFTHRLWGPTRVKTQGRNMLCSRSLVTDFEILSRTLAAADTRVRTTRKNILIDENIILYYSVEQEILGISLVSDHN